MSAQRIGFAILIAGKDLKMMKFGKPDAYKNIITKIPGHGISLR
jgi:hypothetical protein